MRRRKRRSWEGVNRVVGGEILVKRECFLQPTLLHKGVNQTTRKQEPDCRRLQ